MTSAELLAEAFSRIGPTVSRVVDGLTADQLTYRPRDSANTICWLVWHLTRIQDDHIADVAGDEQVWTAQGWADRFGLPLDVADTGYGHTPAQVAEVAVSDPALLIGYLDAVLEHTTTFVAGLDDADLDRVVDENWDPPVTLGVRLVSVISDDLQHAGQAAYLKGLLGSG